jgi:peptidoglycan/xylan/chitin deacetylase (PgdA/CDA1 family)
VPERRRSDEREPGRVSLTFDNGPTTGVTEFVLDELGARGMRATFFVIGSKISSAQGYQLAERAYSEGHWIGNHTLSHSVPLGELPDPSAVDREIDGAQALLGPLAHPDRLFRPYGSGGVIDRRLLGPHARQRLLDGGFTCCLWNCVPRDWLDPHGWVGTCRDMIRSLTWAVIALHDLPTGAMAQLPLLLDGLEAAGVEIRQDLPDSCTPIKRGVPTESFGLLEV